jgi:hypothetical protein
MAKIETYSLDEALTANDKLVGSSYQPGGSYVTASYTLGQVRDYMSTAVGELQDRWSTISYKFSAQDIYDLGDAESGVLELNSVSEDTFTKYWELIPAVSGKGIVVSNMVVYGKYNTTNFNVNYTTGIAIGYGSNTFIDFQTSSMLNITSSYIYRPSVLSVSGNTIIKFNIGSPLMLMVTNSTLMTEGDSEFGIWIEYKYFDFNTDF